MLGSPVAHSLSPALHRAGYQAVGLDWSYDAVEVRSDGLAGFLDGLDPVWRGLSLTMPLKRTAVPLVDELTERAAQAGSVNTVLLDRGHRTGDNTDVPGAAAAIRERYDGPVERAVIVGGGATAASTLLALADLGCRQVMLVVRDETRAAETLAAAARHPAAPEVDLSRIGAPAGTADILVSTVPAAAQSRDVVALAGTASVVFDVVYDPWPTPLATYAVREGRTLVAGLDLLVHQAVLQFALMTGIATPPVAAMRAAGEQALAGRADDPV